MTRRARTTRAMLGWRACGLMLCAASCDTGAEARSGESTSAESTSAESTSSRVAAASAARDPRVFDPGALAVGDRIAGLTVERVEVSRAFDSSYVGEVRFGSEMTLRGRVRPHPDHPEVRLICFDADSASSRALPRWPRDERRIWFCFDNRELASRELGPPGTEATVVIDRYQTVRHFSDAYDTATLIRAIRRD